MLKRGLAVAVLGFGLALGCGTPAFAQGGGSGAAAALGPGADADRAAAAQDSGARDSAAGRDAKSEPFKIPELTSPVMDQAGVLSAKTVAGLDNAIRYLREKGGAQITVLTLPSLGGLSIEEASIKITDQWKLGTKRTDDGVLFLIAPHERRMRIEVGRGLEGSLTDAISSRIIRDSVTPLFKSGDLDSGVMVGVYKIAQVTNPDIDISEQLNLRRRGSSGSHGSSSGLIIFIIIFVVIWLMSGRGGRRGGGGPIFWGGGGFGGGGFGGGGGGSGGWGGGGGGFSGGGSSGSW